MPSVTPTTKTASHSRPLAACSDARVTPSTVGACWASARSSSSATKSRSVAPGRAAPSSSASRASAASDSQRSRTAPPPAGGWPTSRLRTAPPRTVAGEVVAVGRAGRTAQQQPRLPHLGAVEEALAAAQDVGDAGVGERLLVGLALAVGAEQHGDLARPACPLVISSPIAGHAVRPRPARRLLAQVGSGPAAAARRARARPAPGRRCGPRPVGQRDDLGRRAVVADQPDHRRAGVAVAGSRAGTRARPRRRCRWSGSGRRRHTPRRGRRATGPAAPAAAG